MKSLDQKLKISFEKHVKFTQIYGQWSNQVHFEQLAAKKSRVVKCLSTPLFKHSYGQDYE